MKKATSSKIKIDPIAARSSAEAAEVEKREVSHAGRRRFLQASVLGGVSVAAGPLLRPAMRASESSARGDDNCGGAAEVPAFEFDEITVGELQEGMKSGKYSARSIAERYLGADCGDRQERAESKQRHRGESGRAGNCGSAGQGAERKRAARAAAWDSGADQRQHRDCGQDANDGGIAGAAGIEAA